MKQNKYETPITFVQKYLPNKMCKLPRERDVNATVDILVREVTEEEFPVALIVHKYESVAEDADEVSIVKAETDFRIFGEEYRYYDGKLYKPVRSRFGAAVSSLIRTPECIPGLAKSDSRLYVYSYTYNPDKKYTDESIVVTDDLGMRWKAAQEAADNYIVFNNGVWKKADEPRYLVLTFGLGHNHGGTGFFIEDYYNPNISAKNYFRADKLDEALAYFNQVASGRGDTKSVGQYDDKEVRIDVLMPEVLKAEPAKDHANGGDPFMEGVESVISGASSVGEAGLLAVCMTMAEVSAINQGGAT